MKNLCFAILLSLGASLFAGSTAGAQTVIADLYNEFTEPASAGWAYLWNPSGVTIGDSANYVAIPDTPNTTIITYTESTDAVSVGTDGSGNNNVSMIITGNTPSIRVIGGLDASVATGDGIDHYAIIRYTIQAGEEGDVTFDSDGINFRNNAGNLVAAYKNDVLVDTATGSGNTVVSLNFGTCAVGDNLDLAFLTPDNGASRNDRRFFISSANTHVFTSTSSSSVLLGDVDLSGDVAFLDINPFIMILSSNGFQAEADINGDGMVTFLDINPFIGILSGNP